MPLALAAACAAGGGSVLAVSAQSAPSGPPVNVSAPAVAFYAPLLCSTKSHAKLPACKSIPNPSFVCLTGAWKGSVSFSYMWFANGVLIPGETKVYYQPKTGGVSLSCKVTATNKYGSTSVMSEPVEVDTFLGGVVHFHKFPDHFECYRVFPVTIGKFVTLADQFGTTQTEVENAQTLCNPAAKNQFGPREPRAHLVCYHTLDRTPVTRQPRVEISNQFGDVQALVQNPEQLCVPSLKREGRRPPPQRPDPATLLDHYRCYRVVQAQTNVPKFVELTDQFGTAVVAVGRLLRLCTPVSKNNEPVSAPQGHLACYVITDTSRPKNFLGNFIGIIKGPKKRRAAHLVVVRNQFGVQRMTTVLEDSVCLPSRKAVINPGGPGGGTTTPPPGGGGSGITTPTLTGITVTPANPTVAKGGTQQFTATGSYSDGSSQNLTTTVTWASLNTSVATISNGAGSQGLATAVNGGSSTITATSGSTSGSTTMAVNCPHNNGVGQTYNDCVDPPGTPGNQATYNQGMALAAAQAWPYATQTQLFTCFAPNDSYLANDGFHFATWTFRGASAGYVITAGSPMCPNPGPTSWN